MQQYAGMAVTITIRNVPDEVREELAARAARSGRSVQEYPAAALAELASRPSVEDGVARQGPGCWPPDAGSTRQPS